MNSNKPKRTSIDIETQIELTQIRFSNILEELNGLQNEMTNPDDNPDYYYNQMVLSEELNYLSSLMVTLSKLTIIRECPNCGYRL